MLPRDGSRYWCPLQLTLCGAPQAKLPVLQRLLPLFPGLRPLATQAAAVAVAEAARARACALSRPPQPIAPVSPPPTKAAKRRADASPSSAAGITGAVGMAEPAAAPAAAPAVAAATPADDGDGDVAIARVLTFYEARFASPRDRGAAR